MTEDMTNQQKNKITGYEVYNISSVKAHTIYYLIFATIVTCIIVILLIALPIIEGQENE
jgi:hypothetical protein